MENSIAFPNLGIVFRQVGQHIRMGNIEIAYYGILVASGIFFGVLLSARQAKKSGQNPDIYYDLAMYGTLVGIVCARLYYVLFSWESYKGDWKSIFHLREGGLAIYGGVLGVMGTVFLYAKRKGLSPAVLLDTIAPGFAAGQMIGRWGNFFNREAFGEYTDNLFAMRLPLDSVRGEDVTELMRSHILREEGISFIQVHPTFLYESFCCFLLLLFLLWYQRRKRFSGEVFLLYLCGYGLARSYIENLRTDQLTLGQSGIPVSRVLAIILILGSLGLILWKNYDRKKKKSM